MIKKILRANILLLVKKAEEEQRMAPAGRIIILKTSKNVQWLTSN